MDEIINMTPAPAPAPAAAPAAPAPALSGADLAQLAKMLGPEIAALLATRGAPMPVATDDAGRPLAYERKPVPPMMGRPVAVYFDGDPEPCLGFVQRTYAHEGKSYADVLAFRGNTPHNLTSLMSRDDAEAARPHQRDCWDGL
jgi:hypothetical protein